MTDIIPDTPLSKDELSEHLKSLPEWKHIRIEDKEYLQRELPLFASRRACFDFLMDLETISGLRNHDATWSRTYRKLTLSLTTHHAGSKITHRDLGLADRINQLCKEHGVSQ